MDTLAITVIAAIVLVAGIFVERILTPLRVRRALRKLLENKHTHDSRALEDPEYGSVEASTDCLTVTSARGYTADLPWSEVEEVHAFKRDLFTVDLICLAFQKCGRDEFYEIDEHVAGYHDLQEILPDRLPNFSTDWFSAVAFPAFESNHQVVSRRARD